MVRPLTAQMLQIGMPPAWAAHVVNAAVSAHPEDARAVQQADHCIRDEPNGVMLRASPAPPGSSCHWCYTHPWRPMAGRALWTS
mmetsp:Transcript_6384/g.10918  ORF Transcript_6384/g.10918 Transcript_6384/m.10918 type:complete len:84 (+) Transcript_6384:1164-1415(+)